MKIPILHLCSGGESRKGFALPTVLIASTVMLAVLTVTLASVQSGIGIALDSSHHDRYAKSAAQSGMVMAKACLRANDYISSWPTNPLKPNTDCTGAIPGGLSAYVHEDIAEGVRSSFSVDPPVVVANGVYKITVNSTAERIRQSTGAVWRTYAESSYATVSVQASFNNVAFGYRPSGAFFGVIDPQGNVTTVGYNGEGQLGNGTINNSTTPQPFKLPSTLRAAQLYTNFLSGGSTMFAITTDGQLYGAGLNTSSQLGNGTTVSPQSIPTKFQLPAGVKAVYVSPGLYFTFVIGDNNTVYSAGDCNAGILGYTYTMSGCSNQSSYKRVALPTVNLSDLNTLPVATSNWVQSTNLSNDRLSAFVRMQGGRVYGWGKNDTGQLGNGTVVNTATPVQVSTLGNTGQPKATQIAFDGVSTWLLDDTGNVWATGANTYGQAGTAGPIGSRSGKCVTNTGNSVTDSTQITINDCNNSASQLIEWAEDGSLKLKPNTSTVKCINNTNGSSTNGNPISIYTCNGSTAQKWTMNDQGRIVNPVTGKCLENPGGTSTNGTGLTLVTCNGGAVYTPQTWPLQDVLTPTKVVLPSGHGTVTRITTDQSTVLFIMTDGTVWGYGLNNAGQLGSGSLLKFNPKIQQYMILPVGRTAVNFYTAKTGSEVDLEYANTFVILDDGSVYGSGANTFGQLGNGTTSVSQIATPVKMDLPAGIRAQTVQYGLGTTVILTDVGRIYTVGNNANGQLGDGTTINSSTPLARQYANNRPIVLY